MCSEYSMQLNQSRLKVLQAQDDLVREVKQKVEEHLLEVSSHQDSYAHLLGELILQVRWLLNALLLISAELPAQRSH